MNLLKKIVMLVGILSLSACSTPRVYEVWHESVTVCQQPIKHVLVLVQVQNEGVRRNKEDNFAYQLAKKGLKTQVSYRINPLPASSEELFKQTQADTLLVFKSTGFSKETLVTKSEYFDVSRDYYTEHFQVNLLSLPNGKLLWSGELVDNADAYRIIRDLVKCFDKAQILWRN